MRKKLVLITAGPTREYLDPVRYISNDSSGRMGFALASAAINMGYRVILITGPVALQTPAGVKREDVISAAQMYAKVMSLKGRADVMIMAAAVADWRPVSISGKKMKKNGDRTSIRLVQNPDILASACRAKRKGQTMIGFALETNDLEKNALTKLKKKGCDWIVANKAGSINKTHSKVVLFGREGQKISLPSLAKEKLAKIILACIFDDKRRAKHEV